MKLVFIQVGLQKQLLDQSRLLCEMVSCQKLLDGEVKEAVGDSGTRGYGEISRGLHETQGIQTPIQGRF